MMNTVTEWSELTITSLRAMGEKVMSTLPNILGAIIMLIVGWVIIKIVVFIIKKALRLAHVEKLTVKINELKLLGDSKIKFSITNVIVIFVKCILFLVFLIVAADIMNWGALSQEIGNVLSYLPKLFSALAIFMIGIYIATFVKKSIAGFYDSFDLAGAKTVSHVVFYIIAVIITITALNQAGIDTTVITNNVTIILGALLLAISIGFGLGSKKIIYNILLTFYARRKYEEGDEVELDGVEGTVIEVDSISMTIKTKRGKMIIPIEDVAKSKVEVIGK